MHEAGATNQTHRDTSVPESVLTPRAYHLHSLMAWTLWMWAFEASRAVRERERESGRETEARDRVPSSAQDQDGQIAASWLLCNRSKSNSNIIISISSPASPSTQATAFTKLSIGLHEPQTPFRRFPSAPFSKSSILLPRDLSNGAALRHLTQSGERFQTRVPLAYQAR